jgi:hypothetical protein
MRAKPLLLVPLLLLASACGVSRGVRPIGQGNGAVAVSAGGPVADYIGPKLPLPLSTVGGVYGVHDRVDIHGGMHVTTAALFGLWGFELGAGALVLDQLHPAAPALMVDVNLNAFTGNLGEGDPPGGLRIFPETDLRASWAWGKAQHLSYTGASAFFSTSPGSVTPAWVLGQQFRMGRTDLTLEGRWIRPGADPSSVTVDWGGIGGKGVLATHLGFRVRFGPGAKPDTGGEPPPAPPSTAGGTP